MPSKKKNKIGYVWTAENDSNTLRVDAKIFASAKTYLRKKKIPDTCGNDLNSNIEGFLQIAVIMSARLGGGSSNLQL